MYVKVFLVFLLLMILLLSRMYLYWLTFYTNCVLLWLIVFYLYSVYDFIINTNI